MPEPYAHETLWNSADYRTFLRGWFESEKTHRPALSFRFLGQKLSMDASLLAKIFQGERHLSSSQIQPVCDLVGLTGNHAEYFRHLVLHAKSKTSREAQACFARLQELRRVAPAQLDDTQASYWDSWLHVALRSLLSCGDFSDDWERMGNLLHPRQSGRKVREAMRKLSDLGMVAKDVRGCWRLAEPFVRDRPGNQARAVRNYHRQVLLLATEALEGLPREQRNVSSLAVAVPPEGYDRIVELVDDFRSRVLSAVAGMTAPDRVLSLGVQLIPMTRTETSEATETV